jgi:hypothetical protein
MSCARAPGHLPIEVDAGELRAYCPYRARHVTPAVCWSCGDCRGLLVDADSQRLEIRCDRAERDSIVVPSEAEVRRWDATGFDCDED